MRPTEEQWKIVSSKQRKLVVIAYAGTGKTSTLVQYAQANPGRRMLYIAYNRAICDEARSKFPKNVDCKTSHQLAHAAFGRRYQHKFRENTSLSEIVEILGNNDWHQARDVAATLNTFLCSGDDSVQIGHTPQDNKPTALSPPELRYKEELAALAGTLWEKMKDEESPFKITHDGLLKLYQLSQPDLSLYYGAILFDEAQDANPVTTAFILAQNCSTIFVGDRHQQIYRFRGADNALDSARMQDADRMYLSNSFRFGPEIAMIANSILALKEETVPLIGRGRMGRICMRVPPDLKHIAVLHRTVAGAIGTAIEYAGAEKKIYWVGGIDRYGISDVQDVHSLRSGGTVRNPQIRKLGSFAAYEARARDSGDRDMLRIIKLMDMPGIGKRLKAIVRQTVKKEEEADVTISTAHRSKGLEWPNVAVADDFPDLFTLEKSVRDDELNLLYVAATRGMEVLVVNPLIEAIMRMQLRARQQVQPGA